ncbi:ribosome-inactivating family protein [Kutzneria buriramensis]|nr:ribosome-inactivating family protein [Kutzneria buriramensis]
MNVSEQIPAHRQDAGTAHRDGRRRRRPATIAAAAIALALAAVAGLLGPLGSAPSAHAEDGNPTYYLGSNNGGDYINFINDIRNRVNDGGSTSVPGAGSGYQVDHTGNWPADRAAGMADFIRVDIHMWGNPNFVRLQLRRSDLYIVGWWTGQGTYNYLGDRAVAGPSDGASRGEWQTRFGESYVNLEGWAGQQRAGLPIDRGTVNGAVWDLWNAGNDRDMARGVLMMTQFISEAARFRPLRDEIALAMNGNNTLYLPGEYADQENSWGQLSGAFNRLLNQPQGTRDNTPMTGYGRIEPWTGRPQRIILDTAVAYAQYVLGTSLHR